VRGTAAPEADHCAAPEADHCAAPEADRHGSAIRRAQGISHTGARPLLPYGWLHIRMVWVPEPEGVDICTSAQTWYPAGQSAPVVHGAEQIASTSSLLT
jgi:hypothetical protein